MYKILKHNKYPILISSFNMSYPSHKYHSWNNNDLLLPYPRVEAIRMNFRYQFVKVWLGIPEYIKCQRTCTSFKNALTNCKLSRYWWFSFLNLGAVYFYFFTSWSLTLVNITVTINSVFSFIFCFRSLHPVFMFV